MPTWAFFLRAVNVSGANLVRMEDLRADLAALGFTGVSTLLASGNVVATLDASTDTARAKVEAAVAARIGRPAAALVRQADELRALLDAVAPLEARAPPGAVFAVALTSAEPDAAALARLAASDGKGDTAVPVTGGIALTCLRGQGETPYTTARLEKLLGVSITARNPNTLRKVLARMVGG